MNQGWTRRKRKDNKPTLYHYAINYDNEKGKNISTLCRTEIWCEFEQPTDWPKTEKIRKQSKTLCQICVRIAMKKNEKYRIFI
jgi:hypothetical protein